MFGLGYAITKEPEDFGVMERELEPGKLLQAVKVRRSSFACYWLGKSEIDARTADPK